MVTDFSGGDEDASLFKLYFKPSVVLLTLRTRNLPFFLVELECLITFDEAEEIAIDGGKVYLVEDIGVSVKEEVLSVSSVMLK